MSSRFDHRLVYRAALGMPLRRSLCRRELAAAALLMRTRSHLHRSIGHTLGVREHHIPQLLREARALEQEEVTAA